MEDLVSTVTPIVALTALIVSVLSYRLALRAQKAAGHDVLVNAKLALGGPFETPQNIRPLVLTVDITNRARGEVTVRGVRVDTPFPADTVSLDLPDDSRLSGPPAAQHRLRGYDMAEWRFDLRKANRLLRGSWGAVDPPSSRVVRVVVTLGDSTEVVTALDRDSSDLYWKFAAQL